jgi:Rieske Fe-S protein
VLKRREFVEWTGYLAGAMCLSSICAGCGRGGESPASGPIAAGNLQNVPQGSFGFVGSYQVILGRDAEGLYAMSAICTHDQCSMRTDGHISASGVTCDCHGSSFDTQGNVITGPARRALDHYRVDVDATGQITVQASILVAIDSRTPVSA